MLLCDAGFAGADTLATARSRTRSVDRVRSGLGRLALDRFGDRSGSEMARRLLLRVRFLDRALGVRCGALRPSAKGTTTARSRQHRPSSRNGSLKSRMRCLDDAAAQSDVSRSGASDLDGLPLRRRARPWVAAVEPVEVVRERVVAIERVWLAPTRARRGPRSLRVERPGGSPADAAASRSGGDGRDLGDRRAGAERRCRGHARALARGRRARRRFGSGVTAILLEPPLAQDGRRASSATAAAIAARVGRWAPIG